MPTASLESKKAYCARTRRSNYAASLRVEGFESSSADSERCLPSREELLASYRKKTGLMVDKYGVGQDPYCSPGSSVPRNRLD